MPDAPQPGWYPDPAEPSLRERRWDGAGWTDETRAVPPAAPGAGAPPSGSSRGVWIGLGVVAVLGLALLVVAGLMARDDDPGPLAGPSDVESVVDGEERSAFELDIGECFVVPGGDAEGLVSELTVVPCDVTHDYEVAATFDLQGEEFPGDDEVFDRADEGCFTRFEEYVGTSYLDSELNYGYFTPTPESWEQLGDREILCYVFADDGPLEGSVEGSGR